MALGWALGTWVMARLFGMVWRERPRFKLEGMRKMGNKKEKSKIDKKMKKLKKAMKKAGKKGKKVDRSDVPLVSPPVTTDLI